MAKAEKEPTEKKLTTQKAKTATIDKSSITAKEAPKDKPTSTAQTTSVAKAGKRSTKAIKEAEEKQVKEDRKAQASDSTAATKPKVTQKPARSRLERRSRNYRKAYELIDKSTDYSLKDALGLAIKTNTVKFDASVELHIKLNVDPRHADQNVRGSIVLPSGSGKRVRVAVFTDEEHTESAKKAGADIVGIDELISLFDKEKLDFDVLISSPSHMAQLGKYARLLGPRGLMPNPKSGTVTKNIDQAVKEAKAGRVEYRVDSTGIIHLGIGKTSFSADQLLANATTVINSLKSAKPSSVKGTFVQSAYIATTMGPSIKITTSSL